jgi:hypothetical protein
MKREVGYTIIEVMLFLAASGAMLTGALLVFGGQNSRVQFAQGMRDLESKIQDTVNDVSTGYFPNSTKINCTISATGAPQLSIRSTANEDIGQNEQCQLLGKVLHFPVNTENFKVYGVVGARKTVSSSYGGETYTKQIETLADAKPRLARVNDTLDLTTIEDLKWGIKTKSLVSGANMFGVYGSLAGGALTGSDSRDESVNVEYKLKSGSLIARGVGFGGTSGNSAYTSQSDVENAIAATTSFGVSNPTVLCFVSANNQETAAITLGESNGSITTKLEFKDC